MKAITLRKIPPELVRAIRQKAAQNRASINKTVIAMLESCLGNPRPAKVEKIRAAYHDLDHLAGTWTEEDARAFEQALAGQRTIDPAAWR